MKRLTLWFVAALIPVAVLGLLFPNRLFEGQITSSTGPGIYLEDMSASIFVFAQEECPHCADFKAFANTQGWRINYRDIGNPDPREEFAKLQEHVPFLEQGVPTIYINGHVIQGYETDETTGTQVKKLYEEYSEEKGDFISFESFLDSDAKVELEIAALGICETDCEEDFNKLSLNLWLVGETDLTLLSLPSLALLLGFLDGFNPCAMWVLITLLTLLINTHDMKKVWAIGGTFLFVSGAIYYLFIAAWLNVFLLIGLNAVVQKIIGVVAVLGGGFYLYEAFGKNPNECKVTNMSARQRTIKKMKSVMEISKWPIMIAGVAVLAVSVNMIELVCTAGLPAIFTQILAFNNVSTLARYSLIGLYILMYMIDDFVIFGIAVYTLHATGLTTKYRVFTLIFGGLLMYGLGILMLFAPELLTFA